MISLRRLLRSNEAAGAAEFAMVLPLLLLLLFGIIDAGRFAWEYNRAEKATQVGARIAVATDIIPGGLSAVNYVGQNIGGVTLTQGDVVPAAALGKITCSKPAATLSCSCTTNPCPGTLTPIQDTGWNVMVQRMKYMKPGLTDANVQVEYSGSGVGYAGDPNGMDISPLVTVKLTGVTFKPVVWTMFKSGGLAMPDFSTTLTAEDSSGTQSN